MDITCAEGRLRCIYMDITDIDLFDQNVRIACTEVRLSSS